MDDIKLNKTDIEKGMRNEERNEAMNMMNSAYKTTSQAHRDNYDGIFRKQPPLEWYGYLHVDDSIHCKRYFDEDDINEVIESDFVFRVHGPFEAESRKEALKVLKEVFDA
jgi:hypothetical protein